MANDLTRLFLEAVGRVRLVNPNVALCLRDDTPDDLVDLGLSLVAQGLSHPAFYNDRVIIDGLVAAGLAVEDARRYQNSTCVEITPVGCSNVQVAAARVYPAKTLLLLLNGGREMVEDPRLRWTLNAATIAGWARPLDEGGCAADLAALATFDGFLAAYRRALARTMRDTVGAAAREEDRRAQYGSNPLVSCFTRDCVARGRDAAAGGARANYVGTIVAGFTTAVDSLLAIREIVYRRCMKSLEQLAAILRRDFEGEEALRQFALRECPKFGNDDPDADGLARGLYDFIADELVRHRTALGGTFYIGVFSGWGPGAGKGHRGAHVAFGEYTGATPDGRRAGRPLSEHAGPAEGADRRGLTAVLNSANRLDHRRGLGGNSLNVRLSPAALKPGRDRRAATAAIRSWARGGGFELQINVVDGEALRRAQRDPEAHRSLTVRIAGYSDYFCGLDRMQQEEIIRRTEHDAVR